MPGRAPRTADRRRAPLVIVGAVLLGLTGCGADGDEGSSPAVDPAITEGPGETVRDGPVAGRMTVAPDTAEAGGEITFEVTNEGKSTLTHGVCPQFKRLDGDAWVDATEQVLGGAFACIELAAVVAPGETGGEQPIPVADSLDGTFRAVLQVTGEDGTSIVLKDAFAVYPP